MQSPYAEILGVPVAVLGLAGYLAIGATTLGRGGLAGTAGASLVLAGLGFSTYLVDVQIALIGAICPWCVVSDGVMTALAALTLLRLAPHAFRRQVGPQT